jgi:hypothetical protein
MEDSSMKRTRFPRAYSGWKPGIVTMVFAAVLFVGCGGAEEAAISDEDQRAAEEKARRATERLIGTLMGEVLESIKKVGLAATVTHCADRAQELSMAVGSEEGVTIRRVTEKTRNPLDAPDTHERRILSHFAAMAQSGELDASTVHVAVVREKGRSTLRFLKPITIRKPCLGCHGPIDTISPEVRQALHSNYPSDLATGYNEGDLRGAVSVLVPLDE